MKEEDGFLEEQDELRIDAADGKEYTKEQFVEEYGDDKEWSKSEPAKHEKYWEEKYRLERSDKVKALKDNLKISRDCDELYNKWMELMLASAGESLNDNEVSKQDETVSENELSFFKSLQNVERERDQEKVRYNYVQSEVDRLNKRIRKQGRDFDAKLEKEQVSNKKLREVLKAEQEKVKQLKAEVEELNMTPISFHQEVIDVGIELKGRLIQLDGELTTQFPEIKKAHEALLEKVRGEHAEASASLQAKLFSYYKKTYTRFEINFQAFEYIRALQSDALTFFWRHGSKMSEKQTNEMILFCKSTGAAQVFQGRIMARMAEASLETFDPALAQMLSTFESKLDYKERNI